jgi:hypothetical protein
VDYTLLFSSSQYEIHSSPKLHLKSYEILHNIPQGTQPLGAEDQTIKKINMEAPLKKKKIVSGEKTERKRQRKVTQKEDGNEREKYIYGID